MEINRIGSPLFSVNNVTKSQAPSAFSSFAEILYNSIKELDNVHADADIKMTRLILGESMDLHDVILAAEKADISLRLMLQVRNRLLEAYQEVMHMQI